jgi:hypothetical protein
LALLGLQGWILVRSQNIFHQNLLVIIEKFSASKFGVLCKVVIAQYNSKESSAKFSKIS